MFDSQYRLIWVNNIFIEIVANGTETNLIIIGNAYKMLNTNRIRWWETEIEIVIGMRMINGNGGWMRQNVKSFNHFKRIYLLKVLTCLKMRQNTNAHKIIIIANELNPLKNYILSGYFHITIFGRLFSKIFYHTHTHICI